MVEHGMVSMHDEHEHEHGMVEHGEHAWWSMVEHEHGEHGRARACMRGEHGVRRSCIHVHAYGVRRSCIPIRAARVFTAPPRVSSQVFEAIRAQLWCPGFSGAALAMESASWRSNHMHAYILSLIHISEPTRPY